MASLVAAFGTSHSPALNSPVEDFPGHVRRDEQFQHHLDREGRRVTYQQLVRDADTPSRARSNLTRLRSGLPLATRILES